MVQIFCFRKNNFISNYKDKSNKVKNAKANYSTYFYFNKFSFFELRFPLAYRFGYQGQFAKADAETNFNNFELRQYEPVTGRWMTTDPFGQYHSPYLAMGNDPVNSIDPTGGAVDAWGCFFISAANAATTAAVVGAGASSLSNGLTGGLIRLKEIFLQIIILGVVIMLKVAGVE